MSVNSCLTRYLVGRKYWQPALLIWLMFCSLGHAEQANDNGSWVVNGVFTSQIADRRPVDQVLILTNDVDTIYFYTDLHRFQGQTITHRWEYEGNVISEKKFDVAGPSWRVYSVKKLKPNMTGKWSVVVTDNNGWPVYVAIFEYVSQNSGSKSVILPPPE